MKLETGCGHLRIQEIDKLLSFISPDFAVIDSNAVCGKLHLIQAANLSLSAHGGNYNLSKDKSTEVLLYLTGQRQISKALKLAGISTSTKSIAWVSFSNLPSHFMDVVKLDEEVISPSAFDFSRFNIDENFDITLKQKIVMTRTAILPVQPR